ncbi:hypothetical protein GCM10007887_17870 [Methylobacterium haplocladii]|nr:hypothetical protein GCM10007887_17870 [Methylobacterium haplocladii]
MPLEDRARLGHLGDALDPAGGAVEPHHLVDHLEIFEPHDVRLYASFLPDPEGSGRKLAFLV